VVKNYGLRIRDENDRLSPWRMKNDGGRQEKRRRKHTRDQRRKGNLADE
jgi:hypothetical protein